jgi:ligand-binding sensor domain-containing protein
MKRNNRIIGLLMFLLPLQLMGQQATIIPIQLPVEFREQRKIDITQDSKGQLWIATSSNGLLKYDGERFVNYKPENNDINSAALPIMECIYADRDDHIWIGNFTDGLSRFNPETETFTNYKRDSKNPSSLSCDSIKTIMQDRDGLLWIGTKLGLDMFDPKTGSFTHITGDSGDALLLDKQDVRKVYEDSNGIIWIGCVCSYDPDQFDPLNGGLYKLDKTTGAITRYHHIDDDDHSLVDNRVRAIFEDSRGVFWIGTSSDGLHTMDREKGIFQRYPYDPDNPYNLSRPAVKFTYHSADYISFINEDAEGQIWIGTFCAGLSRYNPGTDKLVRFNTDEKAPFKTESNDFFSCIKTKDNLLWITDWYPGRNGYTFYRVSTSFNTLSHVNIGKSVYPFAQTTDSILWMGTSSGLVRKNSGGSFDTLFVSENKRLF